MPSKEYYRYRILKTYSLIVDFEGKPERENVPSPINGETYGQWKNRVLGDSVINVVIYSPKSPPHQTKISTIQNQAGAESLEKVFTAFGRTKDKKKESAVLETERNTELRYEGFSKDTLNDVIEELRENLEPSVIDFLNNYLNKTTPNNINTEELITQLVIAFNKVAITLRKQSDINSHHPDQPA